MDVWVSGCLPSHWDRPLGFLLVFTARCCGESSSWHRAPGLGSLVWVGNPHSQGTPPSSKCPFGVWGQPVLCLHSSFQSECGLFFMSLVIGVLFSQSSDDSWGWLLYNLLTILMIWWEAEDTAFIYSAMLDPPLSASILMGCWGKAQWDVFLLSC